MDAIQLGAIIKETPIELSMWENNTRLKVLTMRSKNYFKNVFHSWVQLIKSAL